VKVIAFINLLERAPISFFSRSITMPADWPVIYR